MGLAELLFLWWGFDVRLIDLFLKYILRGDADDPGIEVLKTWRGGAIGFGVMLVVVVIIWWLIG